MVLNLIFTYDWRHFSLPVPAFGLCELGAVARELAGEDQGKKFVEYLTESQNHRIVGVGRDLCGSSSPTPLPKQGHLQ